MKLKKASLLTAVKAELLKLGYTEIKDSITGAQGLFVKVMDRNFYLTLGMEISNLYDTKFTASFYLSKTTEWAVIWGDIPNESYKRVGIFLTKEERILYLDEEHNEEGVLDAWWDAVREGDYPKFIEVVKITEPRFLGQEDLFNKIENSQEVKKMADNVIDVFKVINKGVDESFSYQFLPKNKIDDIPTEWFKAAEMILTQKEGILNHYTVKNLAGDAWRQSKMISSSLTNLR